MIISRLYILVIPALDVQTTFDMCMASLPAQVWNAVMSVLSNQIDNTGT